MIKNEYFDIVAFIPMGQKVQIQCNIHHGNIQCKLKYLLRKYKNTFSLVLSHDYFHNKDPHF